MDTFALYLQQFLEPDMARSNSSPYRITDILADFHLLRYLAVNHIVPFSMVRQTSEICFMLYETKKSLGTT